MGLKINFKFEILGFLVQNPHIQQAFFFCFNFCAGNRPFLTAGIFYCDRLVKKRDGLRDGFRDRLRDGFRNGLCNGLCDGLYDGLRDGWVSKRFSDFAQNFFR